MNDLPEMLSEFFGDMEPEQIHAALHVLHDLADRAKIAELPRSELVNRAIMLEDLQHAIGHLLDSTVEAGELPESVRDCLDQLFELYGVMIEDDHSAEVSVPPTGHIQPRRNGRGRSRS